MPEDGPIQWQSSQRDDSPEYRAWREAQLTMWTEATDFAELIRGY